MNSDDAALALHADFVDGMLAERLPGCRTLSELMPRLAGAGPLDALAALRRLSGPPDLKALAENILSGAGTAPGAIGEPPSALPLPHPLDSEWRFRAADAEALAEQLVALTSDGDEILLVGVPTVAEALAQRNVDRSIVFVGPPDVVTASIEALFEGDSRLSRSPRGAAAALVDPPWYRGPFDSMLDTCARGCLPGAPVLTVMPREATRPGAAADVAAMLSSTSAMGLCSTSTSVFEVAYRTPLFEACALERAGVGVDLPEWRRGDCMVLRRDEASGRRGRRIIGGGGDAHVELTLDGCRARLRLGMGPGPSVPAAVEDEEVSASISARSPTRRLANLWTSTNRALRVDEDLALDAFLEIGFREGIVLPERLAWRRRRPITTAWVDARAEMIQNLVKLFDREFADSMRLAGGRSWLRGAKAMTCSSGCSTTFQPKATGVDG